MTLHMRVCVWWFRDFTVDGGVGASEGGDGRWSGGDDASDGGDGGRGGWGRWYFVITFMN